MATGYLVCWEIAAHEDYFLEFSPQFGHLPMRSP